jgi:hypothetical protein
MLLETIGMTATNPNSVLTAVTMAAGDSNIVRNFDATSGKRAYIIGVHTFITPATGGDFQIRSALLHDVNVGMNFTDTQLSSRPLMFDSPWQGVKPQDALQMSLLSTAAGAIDAAAVTIMYDDVNGSSANLIDYKTLLKLGKGYLTSVTNTFALGATTGWGGATAFNAAGVLQALKANTWYAILGANVNSVAVACIGIRGIDTGNVRVGIPGCSVEQNITRTYFMNLSKKMFLPVIPCFNSANMGNTFVDVLDHNVGYAGRVSIALAELSGKPM